MLSTLDMRLDALAVANYFIDLAIRDNVELRQLGLMKRVYITHGFCLAILNRPALNKRFDVVEAWKNGPVIPSVYHSFKHHGNNPIKEKSCIVDGFNKSQELNITTPTLEDVEVRKIADMVWKVYCDMSDFKLVSLLHSKGTPWDMCYVEGENREIPDLYTRIFYQKQIDLWMKK